MEKKMTAVEWLESKLENLLELYTSEWDKVSKVINQAKAMERQQIEEAYGSGYSDGACSLRAYEKYGSKSNYFTQTYQQ